MNVLIVDDDTALVAMLFLHFEERGFTVSIAHSCRDARTIIAERKFDLALVDYQLPDGTGLELLGIMRETALHLRIIMMSGIDESQFQDRLGDNGLQYFLPKPIQSAKLDAMVRKALKNCDAV